MKRFYYQTMPYDWRPGQLYYRLKCFLWYRYSTTKPRYLDHTWCDKVALLPHTMFELLSRFIERECSPGHIEWYGEYGHKIGDKYVRDIMQEAYDWWHKIYNKWHPRECDRIRKEVEKCEPIQDWVDIEDGFIEYRPIWESGKDEEEYYRLFSELHNLENDMEKQLDEYLHKIIELRPYLWT